jgi:hypothetical protein
MRLIVNRPPWPAVVRAAQAAALALAFVLVGGDGATKAQSLTYSSGQNVSPAFEGWDEDPDGTRYFVFGYMNRNWVEEVDVPVGPDNGFNVGGPDRGQPTHFLPRRNRFIFRVPVPKGFTDKDELVWTLTTKGKVERAYASIKADYKLDVVAKMSETGALGAGFSSPEIRANQPPVVKVEGSKTVTAKVGQPLRLSAIVTDDGVPKPRAPGLSGAAVSNRGSRPEVDPSAPTSQHTRAVNRASAPPIRVTPGKTVGLHATWFVYRGSGKVTFDPEQISVWEDTRPGAHSPWAPVWSAPVQPADGRNVVHATFTEPGAYVIRVRADDGGLTADEEIAVTVTN